VEQEDEKGINFYEDDNTKLKIYKAFMNEGDITSLTNIKNKIIENEEKKNNIYVSA
jgi:hypothetical protein